jgi:hypothetical protein
MECVGIFMDAQTHKALFNPELALRQGHRVITEFPGIPPEELMIRVSTTVRYSEPYAALKYQDAYSELIVEIPTGDYNVLICADAPFYSGVPQ